MQHPQPGQPKIRQDGQISLQYLRGFQHRLSQLLIQANYQEIISVGMMIHEAKAHRYWEQWPDQDPPFKSYGEWCWATLHYRERKADALAKIAMDLTSMHLSEPTLYRALKLGWTKLDVILRAARTEDGMIRWLDRVETHNLTQDELHMEVKGVLPEGRRTEPGVVPTSTPKGKSRPTKRQRTEEGSDAYDEDEDEIPQTVYPPEGPPAKNVRKTMVFEDEDSARIVFQAIKVMKDAAQGELGAAAALTNICAAWMAHQDAATAGTMGGQVVALEKILRGLEVAYGVPLAVGDEKGLLAQCHDLMTSWGCAQHDDKRVRKLMADLSKVLRR